MKKILIMLMGGFLLWACTDNHGAKTEAQKTVLQYLLAATPEERAPFVLNPQDELPRMQKMYGSTNLSWKDRKFKFTTEQSGPNGAMVMVEEGTAKSAYALFKEGNSFKIAWSLSQFLNNNFPTGDNLKKMYLDPDKQKHSLFVTAQASTFYNWAFLHDSKSMYAFELHDSSMFDPIYGYCYKNNANCKELFNKLKGSSSCVVSLDAWYPNKVFRESKLTGAHAEIGNIQIQLCI